jgi:hypothetical protein
LGVRLGLSTVVCRFEGEICLNVFEGAENSFGVYEEDIRGGWKQLDNEHLHDLHLSQNIVSGPGSSVGIVTDYGLHGPGIESRWG